MINDINIVRLAREAGFDFELDLNIPQEGQPDNWKYNNLNSAGVIETRWWKKYKKGYFQTHPPDKWVKIVEKAKKFFESRD